MGVGAPAILLAAFSMFAHIGSPDVYFEGEAGAYHVLVTVNPPAMVPGIAQVRVRVTSGTVSSMSVVPVYLTGKDQGLPPTPDVMQPVAGDPQSFTGQVWLMASGSWEVRVVVEGAQGEGRVAVPVPASARRTLPMQKALGVSLLGLMLFLSVGIVAIAGAAAREGVLKPGAAPSPVQKRFGRIAMLLATAAVIGILALGNWWWNLEAADLTHSMIYAAPPLAASLDSPGHLTLRIGENFWHDFRKDRWSMDLIPDHGHLMHAFLLRVPAMDEFYHLHPEKQADGSFGLKLPSLPAGRYEIFADIVRGSGFPETMVAEMILPDVKGEPFNGDDSGTGASAYSSGNSSTTVSVLPDGSRMEWIKDDGGLKRGELSWLRFQVKDAQGKPAEDLEPYMGMAGHAIFVRSDQTVFAHIHPAGSVPMASLALAQQDMGATMDTMAPMAKMDHGAVNSVSPVVSFPYGFPQAGDYRLFVQIKRHGEVETGVFDARVTN
jgi:hypothetical protein